MVEATIIGEDKAVKVGLIQFFVKEYSGIYEAGFFKRECARVSKMIENGFEPDFYTSNFNYDGGIYKFDGFGTFYDTPDFGKFCGKLIKKGKKYFIILMKDGESYKEFCERTKGI
jgi:hypothetical protein